METDFKTSLRAGEMPQSLRAGNALNHWLEDHILHVCVGAEVPHVYPRRPKFDSRYFCCTPLHFFFFWDKVAHWAWNSPALTRLAAEPMLGSVSAFQCCGCAWLLHGCWESERRSLCLNNKHCIHWAISLAFARHLYKPKVEEMETKSPDYLGQVAAHIYTETC